MSGIKRFNCEAVDNSAVMEMFDPEGEYVLYSDHEAEVARLRAEVERLDDGETQAIKQRDHAEKIIDKLCDAVLGNERAEWSTGYYFEDAVDDVETAIYRLRSEMEQVAGCVPGVYYMDPPDGGSPSIPEQVRRMAEDAQRYRWLQKQTPYRFGKIQAACVIDAVDTLYFKADEFDAQIDAAMGEGK